MQYFIQKKQDIRNHREDKKRAKTEMYKIMHRTINKEKVKS